MGVLFDLDGTLIDTAPDLVGILNQMLREDDHAPVPYAIARNVVSRGARALLELGYGQAVLARNDAELSARFLHEYTNSEHNNSRLFIDLFAIFNALSHLKAHWGIVTNKPEHLTTRLLRARPLPFTPSSVVCGDTLPTRKPDPAPLLLAAQQIGIAAPDCIYVGDSRVDIDAGRAAGMRTVAAGYGYIASEEQITDWGADITIQHPRELTRALAGMWP